MPDDYAIYDFHDQIGHLLRRAYQRHVAIFLEAIPDTELTVVQFITLCSVRDADGCSLNDIVKSTAIDQATIRGVVDRLKTRDLLTANNDLADGRKIVIHITEAGRTLVGRIIPFALEVTARTYGTLNPAECVALMFLLRKMIGIAA